MTAKEILRLPYSRVLTPEKDGGFSASVLEFPGCFAQGDSVAEAYANLEGAAESWLEAAFEQQIEIPQPVASQRACGKLLLRRSRSPKLERSVSILCASRPPAELLGALHDRIHPTSGALISASPVIIPKNKTKFMHGRQCGMTLQNCADVKDHEIFMAVSPYPKRIELPITDNCDQQFYIVVDSSYDEELGETFFWCSLKEKDTNRPFVFGARATSEKLTLVNLIDNIELYCQSLIVAKININKMI